MLRWHHHIDAYPPDSAEQILLRWLRCVDRRDWLQARRLTSHFGSSRVTAGNMAQMRHTWKDVRIEDIADIVRRDIPSEDPDQPGCALTEISFTAKMSVRGETGRWVSMDAAALRMRLLRHDALGVTRLHDTEDSSWRVIYFSLAPQTTESTDDETTTPTDAVETPEVPA